MTKIFCGPKIHVNLMTKIFCGPKIRVNLMTKIFCGPKIRVNLMTVNFMSCYIHVVLFSCIKVIHFLVFYSIRAAFPPSLLLREIWI